LDYTRQAFYKQQNHHEKKWADEQKILAAVREIRQRQPMIGARKIQRLLRKQRKQLGICIGRDRLFTLLREHDLLIAPKKKYVKTTNSYHRFHKYNNLIKGLDLTQPDQVYVADITYLTTVDGFVYLSLITDLFSRKIVGYYLSQSLGIDGCLMALKMALNGVIHPENLIHHSDRGLQYCSQAYVALLIKNKVKISMTEQNHVYENAVAERVNGILKNELLLGETLTSFKIAQQCVAEAVQIYNAERPHLSLNYQTPDEVYYAPKEQPCAPLPSSVPETSALNLNTSANVDNSAVINTQSTSYPPKNGGFQHISKCLKSLKINNLKVILE
jgi:transposase InsO family protein